MKSAGCVMRKIIIIAFLGFFCLFLLAFQCRKKNETTTTVTTTTDNRSQEKINMDEMKKKIDESAEMSTEIFIAIAVYHKYYTSSYEEQTKGMNDEEKSKFYEGKKVEFFKTIKYSEKEYNDYMQKNSNEINEYIINHPEITEYLTSNN
jgi:hypothetical protein